MKWNAEVRLVDGVNDKGTLSTYLEKYPSNFPIPRVDEAIYIISKEKDFYVSQIRYIPLAKRIAIYVRESI